MEKLVSGLLLVGCLTVSYTIKAKRQNIEKTAQALQAQSNVNSLNARLDHAKADKEEIKEDIDASIPKTYKRKLTAVQGKITKLQKQLVAQKTEEQNVRDKMGKSIPSKLKKQLENKELEINYLKNQVSVHTKHLAPYISSSSTVRVVV